tara:strand:- start:137 stop:883 length:747 start_codon:yes stop_codon:yes gene_type:complete
MNATGSLAIFIPVTIVYFILKYYLIDSKMSESGTLSSIITIGYLIIIVGYQIGVNISQSSQLCNGTPQVLPAIMYTLLPNFLIFGTLILLLNMFPGWRAPFSNTIGFMVVSVFMGMNGTFNDLLETKKGSKLLEKICTDKSLIINEMTHANYDIFLSNLSKDGILNPKYTTLDAYKDLWKYIAIKNNIADFIWYTLTGMLVIFTTSNALLDIRCSYTEKQSAANSDKFEESQNKMNSKDKPKFYTQRS